MGLAWETGAPCKYYLESIYFKLLKLGKTKSNPASKRDKSSLDWYLGLWKLNFSIKTISTGIQTPKQGRQELPGLIFQSMIVTF